MALSPANLIRLQSIPGIGAHTVSKMLNWVADDDNRLSSLFTLDVEFLKREFKLKDSSIDALHRSRLEQAEATLEAVEAAGFRLITRADAVYPSSLRERLQENAPPLLYLNGFTSLLSTSGIAFSGSRHASDDGLRYTKELSRDAVAKGYTIVSGHAPGVDTIAHQTALEHSGQTILVVPEGALKFNLRTELRELYAQHPERLAIVSEFPPQMPWSAQNAMHRNGTIIGLAQALIVIEAGDSGGTLGAGQQALKLNVPTFVLDYPEPPPGASGNRLLLEQGAAPITVAPALIPPNITGVNSPSQSSSLDDKPQQLTLF